MAVAAWVIDLVVMNGEIRGISLTHIPTPTQYNNPSKLQPLPAQRSVRIAAAEKGQADLHIQLIAVAGEGEAAVVHTVGALAVATPSGAEGEEEVGLVVVSGVGGCCV